jgi:drug/metabolite transporter superfamily protein YnfA
MSKTFEHKVVRRLVAWAIGSVVVLGVILLVSWALLALADDVENWQRYITVMGGMMIVLAFFFGQAVERIIVRSWDTWIGDLGPAQARVLIQSLKEHIVKENPSDQA